MSALAKRQRKTRAFVLYKNFLTVETVVFHKVFKLKHFELKHKWKRAITLDAEPKLFSYQKSILNAKHFHTKPLANKNKADIRNGVKILHILLVKRTYKILKSP